MSNNINNNNASDGVAAADAESMHELTAQLRVLYAQQMNSSTPQRDVIYQCAVGLSESELDSDLAIDIFEELIEQGYLVTECKFHLSKLYFAQGFIVKAKVLLNQVLASDPSNQQAVEFKQFFDSSVRNEGKLAIYGLIGLGAIVALIFAWRRSQRNNRSPIITTSSSSSSSSSNSNNNSIKLS
jgi:tetratricopeptide (TPR) repeat protein